MLTYQVTLAVAFTMMSMWVWLLQPSICHPSGCCTVGFHSPSSTRTSTSSSAFMAQEHCQHAEEFQSKPKKAAPTREYSPCRFTHITSLFCSVLFLLFFFFFFFSFFFQQSQPNVLLLILASWPFVALDICPPTFTGPLRGTLGRKGFIFPWAAEVCDLSKSSTNCPAHA